MMKDDTALRQALFWSAVGELSSRVAHESNNLLAGILGHAELGLLSNDHGRMKSSLESVVKSARELKVVTEGLLTLRRQTQPSPQNANLVEIFRTLFGLLERAFTKAGIQVDRRYGEVPTTWCNPEASIPPLLFMLRHALETLRQAGAGGVVFDVRKEAEEIVFRVRVSPAQAPAAEPSTPRSGDFSREQAEDLARQEGGSLNVEREGAGWLLTCRFPVRKAETAEHRRAEPASKPRSGAAPAANRGRLSVLVVEDEPSIRLLIQEVLESAGCLVTVEAEARAALETFGRRRFDAVLTDILMPGMDGVELVRELRARDPGAVVIVVTGRASEDAARAAFRAGAKKILCKPFELAELRTIVETLRSDASGESLRDVPREPKDALVT